MLFLRKQTDCWFLFFGNNRKLVFLWSVWFTLFCWCQAELKKEAVPQQDDSDLEKKRREADALLQSMGITSDTPAGRSPTHLGHTHGCVSLRQHVLGLFRFTCPKISNSDRFTYLPANNMFNNMLHKPQFILKVQSH